MIFTLQKLFNKLKKKLTKNNIINIIVFAIIIVIVSSLLFYLFEVKARENITVFDSLWWGFVTVTTVGYGDLAPITVGGKIVATFLMMVGIGSFGLITAAVATIFIDKMFKGENGKMKINIKDHIVIFGWNSKTKSIIEEIKNENIDNDILVVSGKEGLKKPEMDIYYVNGVETDDSTLELANIEFASKVIVLSDETLDTSQMKDAKSVLICLAIDKINSDIHIVAEVSDENNVNHFKRANVDDYIVTNQISSKIIARGALHKHVSETIKELTTNSFGNEIYEIELKKLEEDMTFKEIVYDYLNNKGCIIIGIVKDGKTVINPDINTKITNGDSLIYINQQAM